MNDLYQVELTDKNRSGLKYFFHKKIDANVVIYAYLCKLDFCASGLVELTRRDGLDSKSLYLHARLCGGGRIQNI